MGRSFLNQPWDRSSRRSWVLILLVAALAVLIGTSVRGLVFSARATQPADPLADPLAAARSREPGLQVLFVGNSFTYFNGMPTMVEQLAAADPRSPRRVFAVQYAPGGSHLANRAGDPALLRLLRSVRWSLVVLQEQSQVPALPYWLVHRSLPAVRKLTSLIRQDGAVPLLFETWGYRGGDVENFPGDSYRAMQARLRAGYAYLARQLRIRVIPVGDSWSVALARRPALALWQPDGHHPTLEGSYLAAATFNAAFDLLNRTRRGADPVWSTFTAGLGSGTAAWLRQVASQTVTRALGSGSE